MGSADRFQIDVAEEDPSAQPDSWQIASCHEPPK
jgi:hypothetical protein